MNKVYTVYLQIISEEGGILVLRQSSWQAKSEAMKDGQERQEDIESLLGCELMIKRNNGKMSHTEVVAGFFLAKCGIHQVNHLIREENVQTGLKLVSLDP